MLIRTRVVTVFLSLAAIAFAPIETPFGSRADATTVSPAALDGCWECLHFEDYRWNWMIEDWVMMDVTYCDDGYDNTYAEICWPADNEFQYPSGEWDGSYCWAGTTHPQTCSCANVTG